LHGFPKQAEKGKGCLHRRGSWAPSLAATSLAHLVFGGLESYRFPPSSVTR
jgi:hypothetical protein